MCATGFNPPAFGDTYEITDVPNRSHILFHQGNVVADTRGCVLLGTHYGQLGEARGVLQSRKAVASFLSQCGETGSFEFDIKEQCEVSE